MSTSSHKALRCIRSRELHLHYDCKKKHYLGEEPFFLDVKKKLVFDEDEEQNEDCKRKLFFDEEDDYDRSASSWPRSVVQLYKCDLDYEENPSSLYISEESSDESQVSIKQESLSRNDLYDGHEYSKDVYEYLREAEIRHRPMPTYMRKQPDINLRMRGILVSWLVDVAEEYELENETLYLSVSIMDRFLSRMTVLKSKFQLVGAASIFIAAKYEDIYPPKVEEFVYMTDNTYSENQLLRVEQIILGALGFHVNVPTTYCFLQHISCCTKQPRTVLFLAQYLCELTLLEAQPFLQFLPSQIAAGAVSLSNYTMGYEAWDEALEETTGYKLQDLSYVIRCLYVAYCNSSCSLCETIREKYSTTTYHGVSSIPPPEELLGF